MQAKINRMSTEVSFIDIGAISRRLDRWYRNYTTRRHLGQLEGWQLDDIGIKAETARKECSKWFWQN